MDVTWLHCDNGEWVPYSPEQCVTLELSLLAGEQIVELDGMIVDLNDLTVDMDGEMCEIRRDALWTYVNEEDIISFSADECRRLEMARSRDEDLCELESTGLVTLADMRLVTTEGDMLMVKRGAVTFAVASDVLLMRAERMDRAADTEGARLFEWVYGRRDEGRARAALGLFEITMGPEYADECVQELFVAGAAKLRDGDEMGEFFLSQAADRGHVQAPYELGQWAEKSGHGDWARDRFTQAAKAGYAPGMVELARLLVPTGEPPADAKVRDEAKEWLEKAMAQGDEPTRWRAARTLAVQQGQVLMLPPKAGNSRPIFVQMWWDMNDVRIDGDLTEPLRIAEQAAADGQIIGRVVAGWLQIRLGDLAKARHHLQMAFESGDMCAAFLLGTILLEEDYDTAVGLFKAAAEGGVKEASVPLLMLRLRGGDRAGAKEDLRRLLASCDDEDGIVVESVGLAKEAEGAKDLVTIAADKAIEIIKSLCKKGDPRGQRNLKELEEASAAQAKARAEERRRAAQSGGR